MRISSFKSLVFFLLCACLSVISFRTFLSNHYNLVGSDIYYYLSAADSLLEFGKLQDLTLDPPAAVITPQNGIVFIMALLKLSSMEPGSILTFLTYSYYFLFLISFYPILKICDYLGFKPTQKWIIAIFYFGHWPLYRLQLIPVNDGLFNILASWLLYLVINFNYRNFWLMVILASVSLHFRVNTAIVLFFAGVVNLWYRKIKPGVLLLCIMLISIFIFKLVYSFGIFTPKARELGNLGEKISYYVQRRVDNLTGEYGLLANVSELFLFEIPKLFLIPVSGPANYLFLIFLAVPLLYFIRGIYLRKHLALTQFAAIVLGTYGFFLVINIAYSNRYFFYAYITTAIMLVDLSYKFKKTKILLMLYLSSIIAYTIYSSTTKYTPGCIPSLLYSLKNQSFSIGVDDLLISQEVRHSYYFLDKPSLRFRPDLTALNNHRLYILGNRQFISDILASYKLDYGVEVQGKVIKEMQQKYANCFLELIDINSAQSLKLKTE